MSFDFISPAYAAASAVPPEASAMDTYMKFAPLIAILALMYFLLIRPQQKRFEEHQRVIKDIRRGDRIITVGGVHATVVKMEGDDVLVVEIADNVRVRIQRASITGVIGKGDAVANSNEPEKIKSA